MQETNDYLNLNFRDIGLKDALIGGTGDPDDIKCMSIMTTYLLNYGPIIIFLALKVQIQFKLINFDICDQWIKNYLSSD